jgi:hypothetical protein
MEMCRDRLFTPHYDLPLMLAIVPPAIRNMLGVPLVIRETPSVPASRFTIPS